MSATATKDVPQLTALWLVGTIGLLLGILLPLFGVWVAGDYPTDTEATIQLGMTAIGNFLLPVGVAALVGGLVLSGVRDMLRRSGQPD